MSVLDTMYTVDSHQLKAQSLEKKRQDNLLAATRDVKKWEQEVARLQSSRDKLRSNMPLDMYGVLSRAPQARLEARVLPCLDCSCRVHCCTTVRDV